MLRNIPGKIPHWFPEALIEEANKYLTEKSEEIDKIANLPRWSYCIARRTILSQKYSNQEGINIQELEIVCGEKSREKSHMSVPIIIYAVQEPEDKIRETCEECARILFLEQVQEHMQAHADFYAEWESQD